jgi:hypothetical protein
MATPEMAARDTGILRTSGRGAHEDVILLRQSDHCFGTRVNPEWVPGFVRCRVI